MRTLIFGAALAVVLIGCGHSHEAVGERCPNCGGVLFVAVPGVTSPDDIREFARRSKLLKREEIMSSGWIHPGAYCSNGDYMARYDLRPGDRAPGRR